MTTYPVMSYAAAHAWERQAAERGVSEVARSPRGFMRAYERAGSFRSLDPWWQRRREGFIARHMAQANRGERLWEKVRGTWRPTRRALALIMWAYMPPGRPAEARSNPVVYRVVLRRRNPVRTNPPQRTSYTCGPAVALDVLADHGVRSTERVVAVAARTLKRTGTTARGLVRALHAHGVPARALKPSTVQAGDLVRLWSGDDDHWVRVRSVTTHVTFYDPWSGRSRTLTMDTFQAMRRQAKSHRFSVVRA